MGSFDEFFTQQTAIVERYVAEKGWAYPHCEPRVLHSPGGCWACDGAPELQALRQEFEVPFTDELEPGDPLLPWADRTKESAEQWPGNRS